LSQKEYFLGTLFTGPEDGPPVEKPTVSLALLFERKNDLDRHGRLPEKPDAAVFFPLPFGVEIFKGGAYLRSPGGENQGLAAQPDKHPFIIVEEESARVPRRGWAEMIRKIL